MYHDKRTQAHLLGNNAGELGGRCPQDMSHHQCPTERERSLTLHAHTTPSAKLIQARWRISTETGDSLPERESGTRERERERERETREQIFQSTISVVHSTHQMILIKLNGAG